MSIELPSSIYHQVTRDLFKLGCDDQTPLGLLDTVVRDLF
jgi:hypothetical protein